MAGDEPVTSPDQHRPTISRRLSRFGLLGTILILIAMVLWGNHEGRTEDVYLIAVAALLALLLIADIVLRKSGLKSD